MSTEKWDPCDDIIRPIRWSTSRQVEVADIFKSSSPDVPSFFDPPEHDVFIFAAFSVMASTPQHSYRIATRWKDRCEEWFAAVERDGPAAQKDYVARLNAYRAHHGLGPMTDVAPPTPELRRLYDVGAPLVNRGMPGGQLRRLQRLGECHWRAWPLDNVRLYVVKAGRILPLVSV